MGRTLAALVGLGLAAPLAAHGQGVGGAPPPNDLAARAARAVSAHINELITSLDACRDVDAANGGVYVSTSSLYLRDKAVGAALAKADEVQRQEARRRGANPEQLIAAQRAAQEDLGRQVRSQARVARSEVVTTCRQLVEQFRAHTGVFRPPEQMFANEMAQLARWR